MTTIAVPAVRARYRPRQLNAGGHSLAIYEVNAQIDPVVDSLLQQALSGEVVDWPAFSQGVRTFVAATPSPEAMDDFFSCLTPVWNLLMRAERFERAHHFWERILDAVTAAESTEGRQVHKGSGYYFWGSNALQRGDTDNGLTLLYEAVEEDLATYGAAGGAPWPASPASKVITLEGGATHPLSWWVATQNSAFDTDLSSLDSPLRAGDLRQRLFMKTETERPDVFLFVHAFTSLLAIERLPVSHRTNEFVARLILGHLFHIAVVIERVLKPKQGNPGGMFADQARRLSNALPGGKLQQAIPAGTGTFIDNVSAQAKADAPAFLTALIDGTATFADGSAITAPDREICIAYTLRNEGGHQSAAPLVIAQRSQDFRRACLRVLSHAVEQWYQ